MNIIRLLFQIVFIIISLMVLTVLLPICLTLIFNTPTDVLEKLNLVLFGSILLVLLSICIIAVTKLI